MKYIIVLLSFSAMFCFADDHKGLKQFDHKLNYVQIVTSGEGNNNKFTISVSIDKVLPTNDRDKDLVDLRLEIGKLLEAYFREQDIKIVKSKMNYERTEKK